jgi:hypothetical protein
VTDHGDANGFLRLDELALEEVDEAIARAGMKGVLPQLHDGGEAIGTAIGVCRLSLCNLCSTH